MTRAALLLAAAALLALGASPAAAAVTVGVVGDELQVDGDANDDTLTVSREGANFVAAGQNRPVAGIVRIRIDTLAGEDRLTISGDLGVPVIAELGADNDTALVHNGRSELVDCGAGTDVVDADDTDPLSACETVQASGDLTDKDRDGAVGATDCDDRDARRRPGRYDIPLNGVDEDCDGADGTDDDVDNDGFAFPGDCDDLSAGTHPGALEINGNAADEDCDGATPPFPRFPAYAILSARFRNVTTVTGLVVVDIDGGDVIRLRCRGRGCRWAERVRRTAADADRMVLDRFVRGLRLRNNARLAVDVIRPDGVVKTIRFKARTDRNPSQLIRCATPGNGPIAGC